MSNVDLPMDEVLGAVVQATGAALLDGMGSEVPGTILSNGEVPEFGAGATDAQISGFKYLRGRAYDFLCEFMREVVLLPPRCWSGLLPYHRPPTVQKWRGSMVRVIDSRGRSAWELKNELGGVSP